jgi:tripartite-type tricarboxylate transporter receptor subunit TctC
MQDKISRVAARMTMGALVALGLATAGAAKADDSVASNFKGRTVNMVIGYTVGGGYDLNARLLAKYLGKHIPGDPYVTPQNMPGAGSLKAAKYLFSIAPKDGTAIGTFGRSIPLEPLLGGGADFDARKLTWLGSITSDVSLCITWQTSKIKTTQDLMTKPVKLAGQGAGSDPDVFTNTLKNLFNPKIKLVTGYPGSNEAGLAMERGEVDGECGVSWSTVSITHPDWVKDHKIHILIQMALERHPQLQNVPLVFDFAKDDETKKVLKVIVASQTFARPFAAPPGMPADITAALRKAFVDTMNDKDFLAEADKLKLEVRPVSYQKIDELLADLYATPPDILAKAKAAVGGQM